MDNRVFNVNGKGEETLAKTLELAFAQEGKHTKAKYFVVDKNKGLILLWYADDSQKKQVSKYLIPLVSKFLTPLSAKAVTPIVIEWLRSDEAKTIALGDWDMDAGQDDGDISTEQGWRVYCERWGHIEGEDGLRYDGSIVAITPAFMWYGK